MIRLLISDFDGTLVDTFEANFRAYSDAFASCGLLLEKALYREYFGLRFDRFMDAMDINDQNIRREIRRIKGERYPYYFDYLKVNTPLLKLLRCFKALGGQIAIASTAREKNLLNALSHIGAVSDFDLILAGENVSKGKPDPEIYLSVLEKLGVSASEAIVFEDSEVGMQAAQAAGIGCINVNVSCSIPKQ